MKQKFKNTLYSYLILIASFCYQNLNAQTYCTTTLTPNCELICNGGFENLNTTVSNESQIHYANGWYAYCVGGIGNATGANTPDLFNASATNTVVTVPCNIDGYQFGHNGSNGYAGIFTISRNSHQPPSNDEYIVSYFSSPLQAGKIYNINFWVSRADVTTYDISSLGIWFSGSPFTDPPSYNCPVNLLNNDAWTLINYSYCANGGETYVVIGGTTTTPGNFGSANSVPTGCYPKFSSESDYIYIDDVSVKEVKFTVPSQTVCANSTVSLTVTTPTNACAVNTTNYTYNWNFGDGSSAVNSGTNISTTHVYTTTGSYTGSLTVNTGSCSITFTYGINVPAINVAITSNTTSICNGSNSFTATPNPAGTYTVSWGLHDSPTYTVIPPSSYTVTGGASLTPTINFANINQNIYVYATLTSSLGCKYTDSLFMPSCCTTPTNVMKYSNTTFSTAITPTGTAIAFSGTITVNSGGNLTIASKDVKMDPNTKFVINGTGKITFADSYVHACNYMWDGIYANGTSTVTISNSRVEDAKRLIIDSLGGVSVSVTNSYLNKNNMGIVFKAVKTATSSVSIKNTLFTCSNISLAGVLPKIPTAVNLTNAPTLGAFTSTVMLPPYSSQKSMCGIYFINASHTGKITNGIVTNVITIGGNTYEENVFDKMQVGVFSYDSKSNIQNNVFQNFKSTIAPSSVNTGINLIGPIFGAGNGSYMNVGGSLALKNTFINNDNGLYNVGKSAILATYNTFSVQTTGVYVTANNNGSLVGVNFNNFYQNGIAVNFYSNTYLNASIKNNNMNNTASAVGTNADNFAIRCTEAALATSTVSFPAFDIDNNNISGFYNGIYAVNTLSLIATDNEVHMRQDNAFFHLQNGISVTGSNANKIINNIIDSPGIVSWANWRSGIFMTSNQLPRVQCNSINNLCNSIVFKYNNSTVAADGVKSNYMQNANFGILMSDNAVIGNQAGNTGSNSADNVWATTCNFYTYSQVSSNPSNHFFYTRSLGSGYDLPSAKAGKDGSANCNQIFGNNGSAAATGTACIANTATPSNLRVAGNAFAQLMQGADDILTDFDNEQNNSLSIVEASANATNSSVNNAASLKAMNRRHLLYNLVLQNIDVQQDAALSGFMNSIKSNNTGLLLAVDSLIHQAEKKSSLVSVAQNANTAIVPTNLVEQGQQEFNTLYLEYLAQNKTLNPSQLSSMINLAQQCPSYYGISVYQARTVLFDITKQTYLNTCENVKSLESSKRIAQTTDNADQLTSVNVFPNPANNQLFVNTNDYAQVNIKLYNIMGILVADKTVINNNSLDISNFANGVYTYKVYNNDAELKVGKLIITH